MSSEADRHDGPPGHRARDVPEIRVPSLGWGLAAGVAPRRDSYAVTIVDHTDAAGLRQKYGEIVNVDTSLVEDVDVVWD